jgi:hypothetical protein
VKLNIRLLGDASTDCIVWVRGAVFPNDGFKLKEFMDLKQVAPAANDRRPRTLQLATALWLLQEKLGLRIWTSESCEPENLLLLMESRNSSRFDLPVPLDPWESKKLYLEPFNVTEIKWFWFQLDFHKAFER